MTEPNWWTGEDPLITLEGIDPLLCIGVVLLITGIIVAVYAWRREV